MTLFLVDQALDLTARQVIVASILYYAADETFAPDCDFDNACLRLADQWPQLSPIIKWQLGSAEEIAASGFHIKVTAASVGGAISVLEARFGKTIDRPSLLDGDRDFTHRVNWWGISTLTVRPLRPISRLEITRNSADVI